ncbi:MAG: cold shock domain-containing protein [Methylophaga sp.]|nr:cold shock domain-containing protein [Methylophaga sp.]
MKEKRLKGAIKYWNGRKGFGFIAPDNEDKQIFVHIKAFTERKGKPVIGQEVSYTLATDDQGRTRAENVMDAADDVESESSSTMMITAVIVVVAIVAAVYFWA